MITPIQNIKSVDSQDIKNPTQVSSQDNNNTSTDNKTNEVSSKPIQTTQNKNIADNNSNQSSNVSNQTNNNESNKSTSSSNSTNPIKTGSVNSNTKNIIKVGSTAPKVVDKPHESGKEISVGSSYHGMHKAGNWVKVKGNNGNTGYINQNNIQSTPVNNSTPVVDQTNHVIGSVNPNDNVQVVSTNQDSNGDVTVIHNNNIGKVNVRAFAPSTQRPEISIPDYISNSTEYIVANLPSGYNLNFRTGPNLNDSIITTIPAKTQLDVLSKSGDWYKIKYQGKTGYVFGGYVKEVVSNIAHPSQALENYFQQENSQPQNVSFQQLENNGNFENMTLNHYRAVNVNMLNNMLAQANAGSLAGQGQTIADAAKLWNVDPVALTAQMALECGWGRSVMGRGTVINQIKTPNGMVRINPTRVYNLMGIGADDGDAYVDGTTYAYTHGWTSIQKAIYGTAEFLSTQYVNNANYNQNTAYRFVHAPNPANSGHDYAESNSYGQMVGQLIAQLSPCYLHSDQFSYA